MLKFLEGWDEWMGRVDGRNNFVMFVMQRESSWRKEEQTAERDVGRRGCGRE
jgi:hypothetical protein